MFQVQFFSRVKDVMMNFALNGFKVTFTPEFSLSNVFPLNKEKTKN